MGRRENWNFGKMVPEHLKFKGPPLFSGPVSGLGQWLTVAYSNHARHALLYTLHHLNSSLLLFET